VMEFWFPGPDAGVAAAARRIEGIEAHWAAHGFGDLGVVAAPDGTLIGFAGLHLIPGVAEVNVGYALLPSVWGRGIGTQVCRTLIAWGLGWLRLPALVAVIDPRNAASIAVATACGLTLAERFVWSGQDRLAYRISASRWRAQPDPADLLTRHPALGSGLCGHAVGHDPDDVDVPDGPGTLRR
jgi:RimJ/RimL family protein N-acetyltransferase